MLRRLWWARNCAALLLLLCVAAVPVYGGVANASRKPSIASGPVDITLQAVDGSSLDLKTLRGKPVLIDMWATWCSLCLGELVWLNDVQALLKPTGLVTIGIDYDDKPGAAKAFLARRHVDWPMFVGDKEFNRAFPHLGIPHVILLDATGTVVYAGEGLKQDALLAAIAKLGPEYAAALPK
jgi:thiol-disulfide isomerase/thioredoxin